MTARKTLLVLLLILSCSPLFAQEAVECYVRPIKCGQILEDRVSSRGCRRLSGSYFNMHPFRGEIDSSVTVTVSSPEFSPTIELIDPTGRQVLFARNTESSSTLVVTQRLMQSGVYQMNVGTTLPGVTGLYSVRIDCTEGAATGHEPCINSQLSFCLQTYRFEVSLTARDPRTGHQATGFTLLPQNIFGTFSLPSLTFNPNDPVLLVKIVDGRPVNGFFWLFYSGTTDVELWLSIRDTETGTTMLYHKEPYTFWSGADLSLAP